MECLARGAATWQGVAGSACCSYSYLGNSTSEVSPSLARVRALGVTSATQRCLRTACGEGLEMQYSGNPFRQKFGHSSSRRKALRAIKAVCAVHTEATTSADLTRIVVPCLNQPCGPKPGTGSCKQLERWIEGSVLEIVRHLQEAPFLHFVFDTKSTSGKPEWQRVSEDLFDKPDCWPQLRDSLLEIAPDGVILVQRLDEENLNSCSCIGEPAEIGNDSITMAADGSGTTDTWGVLVQARCVRLNACYLLKTTRVLSTTGACTRFCLVRAKCFGPSLSSQLENVWL